MAHFQISLRTLVPTLIIGVGLASCKTLPESTTDVGATVSVSGSLSDDEAARLALINNASFRELMTDLGIADAELIQAKQLPNPNLSVLFPLGPKQLEYTAKFPVEALWLRPHRAAVAKQNAEAIGERLVQDGLNLVRDVKLACAELRLAERKLALMDEEAETLNRFAKLANARLEAGEISELEVTTARTDALSAEINRDRAPHAVKMAREKLRNLLGVSNLPADFSLSKAEPLPTVSESESEVLEHALAARPDLRAAEIAVETEAKRVGLADKEVFQMTAIFDANGAGSNFEAGPGIDIVLPIFNQGQGAKAIADAKFKKASLHYIAVRDQIALEVRQALARYNQAQRDLKRLRTELLPAMDRTIDQSERAWEGGEVPYLFVIDSTRKVQAAKLNEAEFLAEWQRAAAELERAVGTPQVVAFK